MLSREDRIKLVNDIVWVVPQDKYVARILRGAGVEIREHVHACVDYRFLSFGSVDRSFYRNRPQLMVTVADLKCSGEDRIQTRLFSANECYASYEEAVQAKKRLIADDIAFMKKQREHSIAEQEKFLRNLDQLIFELEQKEDEL